ncbi:MAG: PAP2 superfamily protein [Chloroflexi bacterium]|nr:MAG: PAP2 superfamily protein [Chloroflexota bacterium]
MELLWNFEINITLFFQALGDWLKYPFKAFTYLGNEEFYILIMPAIYWCVSSIIGVRTGIMLVISGGLNTCLKFLFHSPRPFWIDTRVKAIISETSFGLPSGHAQNAASIWGTLAASTKKKWVTILLLIVILFIGLSRIYLGVHFTRDVLAGWLVGGLIVWIYFLLEKRVAKWLAPKKLGIQILYVLLFSASIILLGLLSKAASANWVMPSLWSETALQTGGEIPDPFNIEGLVTLAGVAFGFLSGFAWWVKKYGVLIIEGSFSKRFLRYFVGIVGVIIFYLGLKMIFPEDPLLLGIILRFTRYGMIGLWVSALAPALFVKLGINK